MTASLVLYNSSPLDLAELFASLSDCTCLQRWIVVNNSAREQPERARELCAMVERSGGSYLAAPRNLGFGAGHNLALATLGPAAEFHLLLNPDILFGKDVLPSLLHVMETRPATALIMPRVLYPNGSPQLLCKLLPTPLDFALRRFSPAWLQRLFSKRLERYELRGLQDTACNKVPFLSGCFMFTRRAALDAVGGFDERFFLYLEDVDLCRRLARQGELLYWPGIKVTHGCYRGAYRSRTLMFIFLRSAFLYFEKWGWLLDAERRRVNRDALACIAAAGNHLR